MRSAALVAFALGLVTSGLAAQRTPEGRPSEATDSAIDRGRALFHGSAGCAACHGEKALYTDVAPPLSGALRLNGPGTYTWLIEHITRGVPAHRTMSGLAMPMRGWSNMSDDEIRAVAAYVWAVTHPPQPVRPQRRRRGGRRARRPAPRGRRTGPVKED